MKTIHLYYTDTSDSWRSTDDFSTFFNETQWVSVATRRNESVTFHPSESAARAAAEAEQPKALPIPVAPTNLKEQLRAEALARAGVFSSRSARAKHDAAFEALWAHWEVDLATARENEVSAQDDLRACQRDNERLRAVVMKLRNTIVTIRELSS